jgi:hypothetical protein
MTTNTQFQNQPTALQLEAAKNLGLIVPDGITKAGLFKRIAARVALIEEESEHRARERRRL